MVLLICTIPAMAYEPVSPGTEIYAGLNTPDPRDRSSQTMAGEEHPEIRSQTSGIIQLKSRRDNSTSLGTITAGQVKKTDGLKLLASDREIPQVIEWEKSLGGISEEAAYCVNQTSDGGYIIAGYSISKSGDVTENYGLDDYWIVKLNPNGTISWQKSLGGSNFEYATGVQQTSDGGYVVAGYSHSDNGNVSFHHGGYDYWIVKLTGTGNVSWEKSLGGFGDDKAASIQQTIDGGFIVTGQTWSGDGNVTGHLGRSDYWVVKMDSEGDISWEKCFGGSLDDEGQTIRQTGDGGYIVAGYSHSVDGNVTSSHGSDNYDYWVVKISGNGDIVWEKSLGGSDSDYANSIQLTRYGGYIVAGGTYSTDDDVSGNHGGFDYWVVNLSETGDIIWQKCLGGTGYDEAESIWQTNDGGYIVIGYSNSTNGNVTGNLGDYDYWVVKLSRDGDIVWEKNLGGEDDDYAFSIQQTTDSGYIIAGSSDSQGGNITGHHSQYDYWIVKLQIPPPPAISGVTPSSGPNNHQVQITNLSGTGFDPSATVTLSRTGEANITATDLLATKTRITCTLPITGAEIGAWNVTVGNPDGQSATLTNGFNVTGPQYEFVSKWGASGSSNGNFSFPSGIAAFADDIIYVSDAGNNRIQKFTDNGSFITKWGSSGSGNGMFNSPAGMIVDGAGNIYISDSGNSRIQKFTSSGIFSAQWGTPGTVNGKLQYPAGIAMDNAENIYVADYGNNRIQKFTGTGIFVTTWGTQGSGEGQFQAPYGLAIDSSGNIYVGDSGNNRIQKFNSSGTFITQWGSTGTGNGKFNHPMGVAVDTANNVFVCDSGNNRIQKFNSTGSFITGWGSQGTSDSEFKSPLNAVIDTNGYVFVTDMENNRVQKFYLGTPTPPHPTIFSIIPSSAPNTGTRPVTITGKNLNSINEVNLTNSSITITGTINYRNSTTVQCSFPLNGVPTRLFTLNVMNPDRAMGVLSNAFQVTNTTPTVTSITPSTGFNSSTIPLTIAGTAFRNGVSISLTNGSTTLPGTITNRTTTKILCTIPLNGTPHGLYNLTILNIDGTSATKLNAFTVNPADKTPTIQNFTPESGVNTAAFPVIINGTYFRKGVTVTITKGNTTKTVPGTIVSATQLRCSLPLTALPIGLYNLTVQNSDGTSGFWENAFRVSNPTPKISSVTPPTGYNTSSIPVTVTGTGFVTGCTVTLVNNSTTIPGSISSFTSLKFIGTFALSAVPAGIYNLTVTNPGGPNTTKTFNLLSPINKPAISDITPASGVNTAPFAVSINGTNFRSGATVTVTNNTTIKTVAATSVTNTLIKCSLPLTGVPIGLYNVTIRNTDGSVANASDAFTVINPTPAITTVSPASGFIGSFATVVISGTKFVNGVQVSLVNGSSSIPGIVSGFTATKFTGTFDLTDAAAGGYNLTVINPGGPYTTKLFTVKLPETEPVITNVTPAFGVNTAPAPVTILGSNFRAGLTVTITNGTTSKTSPER